MTDEEILAGKLAKAKLQNLELRMLNSELKAKIKELQIPVSVIMECPNCQNSFDLLQKEIKCPKCKAVMERQREAVITN